LRESKLKIGCKITKSAFPEGVMSDIPTHVEATIETPLGRLDVEFDILGEGRDWTPEEMAIEARKMAIKAVENCIVRVQYYRAALAPGP